MQADDYVKTETHRSHESIVVTRFTRRNQPEKDPGGNGRNHQKHGGPQSGFAESRGIPVGVDKPQPAHRFSKAAAPPAFGKGEIAEPYQESQQPVPKKCSPYIQGRIRAPQHGQEQVSIDDKTDRYL
jgi:hypothetical protein